MDSGSRQYFGWWCMWRSTEISGMYFQGDEGTRNGFGSDPNRKTIEFRRRRMWRFWKLNITYTGYVNRMINNRENISNVSMKILRSTNKDGGSLRPNCPIILPHRNEWLVVDGDTEPSQTHNTGCWILWNLRINRPAEDAARIEIDSKLQNQKARKFEWITNSARTCQTSETAGTAKDRNGRGY